MSLQEEARRRAQALRLQNNFPNQADSDSDEGGDALFAAANALRTPSSVGTAAAFNPHPTWNEPTAAATPFQHDHAVMPPFPGDVQGIKVSATGSTSAESSPSGSTPSSVVLNYSPDGHDDGVNNNIKRYNHNVRTTPGTSPYRTTPKSIAAQARREWQNHGTGVTQALEEVRYYNHHDQHQDVPNVRVFASSGKVDAAGQDYTAYLIRVEYPNDSSKEEAIITEHRFSDFYKLQQQLEGIVQIPVVFPSRMTWAGRLGNWTPSQVLAPDQHQSLIEYRLKQLDAWLVHVVQLMPRLPTQLQEDVRRFLDAKTIVPCQQPLRMMSQKSNSTIAAAAESLSWNNPVTFTMGSALRQACRTVETLCHLPEYYCRKQNQLLRSPPQKLPQQQQMQQPSSLPEADQTIPLDLLRMARGILFVTVAKAGWVVSGRIGTGLLIQRLNASTADTTERAEVSAGWFLKFIVRFCVCWWLKTSLTVVLFFPL